MADEMLGPILLSIHNVTYYQRLVAGARQAIEAGTYDTFMTEKIRGWNSAAAVDSTAERSETHL
jgi:queuine tRNA-ribosyltransferase